MSNQNNQAIKLLKQLIGITTNKKDKAELMLMLKQTTDDTTQTKQKKFNIRNFPATKAKAVGFKTKKAMIEFVDIYNSEYTHYLIACYLILY